ncbi:NF-kappa-B-repressing factor-like isoform X1 [Zophobas morio]|uniref:NF-kappa-B-repressing factor-like isoform X1 n=1 Tax=Zophobas morio TaxID=2755281 RepID=UPI003083029E
MSSDLKRKLSTESSDERNKKRSVQISEEKIAKLVNAVLEGPLGNLVIILQDEGENPYVTLQNALAYLNISLTVTRDDTDRENFDLRINGVEYARGSHQNVQLAKRALAEQTLEKLRDVCFFIEKKGCYVNVTKENLQASTSSVGTQQSLSNVDSIAQKIMMKMGWTGGGLGAHGQGTKDSVILCENINRQGLGTTNITKEITKILDNFSKSSDLLTLVFNSDFTKEERALIHRIARKYNLKSKSTGSESRKLSVSKKITRIDIVRELLKIGGEDGLYKLHIPKNFENLWF